MTFFAGFELETDIKSFLKINKNIPKVCEQIILYSPHYILHILTSNYIILVSKGKSFTHKADKKLTFKKQVREATSFMQMATHLEEMIQWCKYQRMEKEKRLLTFLRLKCQKMKCLEAAGYK